jgi:hypothetical protein
MIGSWTAWPLASLGATVVYVIVASVQLAIAEAGSMTPRSGAPEQHSAR